YCYERAKKILTEHKDQLELIAQTLLEVETLDQREINTLFHEGYFPEPLVDETSNGEEDVKVCIQSKEDKEAEAKADKSGQTEQDDDDKAGKSFEEVKKEVEKKHEEEG